MTETRPKTKSPLSMPLSRTPSIPDGATVMTLTVELPPGHSGAARPAGK